VAGSVLVGEEDVGCTAGSEDHLAVAGQRNDARGSLSLLDGKKGVHGWSWLRGQRRDERVLLKYRTRSAPVQNQFQGARERAEGVRIPRVGVSVPQRPGAGASAP